MPRVVKCCFAGSLRPHRVVDAPVQECDGLRAGDGTRVEKSFRGSYADERRLFAQPLHLHDPPGTLRYRRGRRGAHQGRQTEPRGSGRQRAAGEDRSVTAFAINHVDDVVVMGAGVCLFAHIQCSNSDLTTSINKLTI